MSTQAKVDRPATRLATRLSFFVAGFGIACWAPIVPLAKHRLRIDDATLGLLLLSLGAGSVMAMIAAGQVSFRYGSKAVIVFSGVTLALLLPTLSIATTSYTLGALLFLFGAALGSLDAATNFHAIEVEHAAERPLMSGFHALFSIGGFAGAGLMTLFISASFVVWHATLICSSMMFATMLLVRPMLIRGVPSQPGPAFMVPRGIVLLLAVLTMVAFLVEGAILDWSALLITQRQIVQPAQAGLGYILFATAMVVGRLFGDGVVARLGDTRTLIIGGLIAVVGFALLLTARSPLALGGFFVVGLGTSNFVPVLFRIAGAQTGMPPALAIGAITTFGYAGILVGPAGVGFVAKVIGLPAAFWLLAALTSLIPIAARNATRVDE